MTKLSTIQKRNKLNEVFAADEVGAGGAKHKYVVVRCDKGCIEEENIIVSEIVFQHGARNDENSTMGVLDTDLLEIVRDRLKAFNNGEYGSRENACAITHIEEALMWLNMRTEDRAERRVLGTMKK